MKRIWTGLLLAASVCSGGLAVADAGDGSTQGVPAPSQIGDPGPVAQTNVLAPPAPPVTAPVGTTTGSNFMDTRLNFTCADEDMLRDPTVLPTAPGFHCGRPNPLGILFFDNYDTRFNGFETLSFLSLYKHYVKDHWDLEAGLVILMNEFAGDDIVFSDGGSFIRAAYWFDETHKDPTRVSLTTFPVSSDRMRLGFSYRISWGGDPEFFKANPDIPGSSGSNTNSTPGAKLQYETATAYAYIGMKSTLLLDPVINEQEGVLAGIGGAGIDINEHFRVEANGGVFDRGKNQTEDVLGKPVTLYGASAQVVVHDGIPIGTSQDYALYRNDPESIKRLFQKEQYNGGLAWLASSEFTLIGQTLKDPDNSGSTRTQKGMAGDINFRLKNDYTRFKVDLMTRDLAFILHSVPSLPTYWDFPDDYKTSPELFASAGIDQYFPSSAVTVGITLGIDKPASLTTPSPSDIPGNETTSTTLVVTDQDNRSVLPAGESVAILFAAKATMRKDFGDVFAALVDVYYQYDPNTVRYDRTSNEGSFNAATFAGFNQLGFDVTLQARF